jgi:antitoxin ParD1/3/4
MNVSLTHELEEFVNNKVQSGHYTSASEVVRDGLRLLAERDQLYQIRLQELRKAVQEGLESGGSIPAEEVYAELHAKNKAQRRKGT